MYGTERLPSQIPFYKNIWDATFKIISTKSDRLSERLWPQKVKWFWIKIIINQQFYSEKSKEKWAWNLKKNIHEFEWNIYFKKKHLTDVFSHCIVNTLELHLFTFGILPIKTYTEFNLCEITLLFGGRYWARTVFSPSVYSEILIQMKFLKTLTDSYRIRFCSLYQNGSLFFVSKLH